MSRKNWTSEDEEYLCSAWGRKSLDVICKHLDRSEQSVINKKHKLGLPAARENNCEYITLNSLTTALYGCTSTNMCSYEKSVILPRMLKIYMIPQPKVKRRCVKLSEFWKMAEANRYLFDFSKLERYALGPEPDWVDKQRHIDEKTNILRRGVKIPWNAYEDSLLISIASKKKYTCNELAEMFKRSEGSVIRRLTDLGLQKCCKRNPQKGHSQDELDIIAELILQGYSYTLIANHIGRSEKSIRGVIYQHFGTESLSKVRTRLQCGEKLEERPHNTPRKERNTTNERQ
ncbi:MAG: hypothetical protein NC078_03350 [Ruminococcus sp.]|nr:hypothetical protein [Ruminococcus sp.]